MAGRSILYEQAEPSSLTALLGVGDRLIHYTQVSKGERVQCGGGCGEEKSMAQSQAGEIDALQMGGTLGAI